MIKSMTGFGKMTIETGNKKIVIEVKSLNSKQLDINLRIPNLYKEKEMEQELKEIEKILNKKADFLRKKENLK